MAKIKLKVVDQISRKKVSDAFDSFMRHCKLKNLAPYSDDYIRNLTTSLLSASGYIIINR